MTIHEVLLIDGVYSVRIGERTLPITHGEPITAFAPGWGPRFLYTAFTPVLLLELKHENGAEATWFLDGNMSRLADDVSELAPHLLDIVKHKVRQILKGVWNDLVISAHPELDQESRWFFALNNRTRAMLLRLCVDDLNIRAQYLDLQPFQSEHFELQSRPGGPKLQSNRVIEMLRASMVLQTDNAILAGALKWPSPVDGEPLLSTHALCLNPRLFMYRAIVDGEAFYITVRCEGWAIPSMVYFPSRNCCFGLGSADATIAQLHGATIENLMLEHVSRFGLQIEEYLKAPNRHFAVLFRQGHVGHHLWNELTEVDRILHRFGADRIPEIILAEFARSEIYGKIDDLFPEIHGKVKRDFSPTEILEYIYRSQCCVLGPHRQQISSALRRRVLEVNLRDPEIEKDRMLLDVIGAEGRRPIVLLGLRVENRTVIDLVDFWSAIVDFLIKDTGAVAIIFDGYNAEAGQDRLLEVEKEVVAAVKARVKTKGLAIIDTLGAPIARSIFWANQANFFISLWGGGLAKYCWVCNKPGLAITSAWNLANHGELHIYDSEDEVEDPQQIDFLPAEFIEDAPDAPLLVTYPSHRPGSLMNFKVDPTGAFPIIRRLLVRHALPTAPTARAAEDLATEDPEHGEGGNVHHVRVGLSALGIFEHAITKGYLQPRPALKVLDLPCGYGRVARVLRTRFPEFDLTVCDADHDAVDFCTACLNARGAYSTADFDDLDLGQTFDFIWVGSLITHLTETDTVKLLNCMARHLAADGLLIVTSHGRFVADTMANGVSTYGLATGIDQILADYHCRGYGFHDYSGLTNYGISIISENWFASALTGIPLLLIEYRQQEWDNHHDVIFLRRPPESTKKRPRKKLNRTRRLRFYVGRED